MLIYWTSSRENVKCRSKLYISLLHVNGKCWNEWQRAQPHNKLATERWHASSVAPFQTQSTDFFPVRCEIKAMDVWNHQVKVSEFKNHHHNQQGQYWSWWLNDSGNSHKPSQSWTGDDTVWHHMFASCCRDTNRLIPNCRAASFEYIWLWDEAPVGLALLIRLFDSSCFSPCFKGAHFSCVYFGLLSLELQKLSSSFIRNSLPRLKELQGGRVNTGKGWWLVTGGVIFCQDVTGTVSRKQRMSRIHAASMSTWVQMYKHMHTWERGVEGVG